MSTYQIRCSAWEGKGVQEFETHDEETAKVLFGYVEKYVRQELPNAQLALFRQSGLIGLDSFEQILPPK